MRTFIKSYLIIFITIVSCWNSYGAVKVALNPIFRDLNPQSPIIGEFNSQYRYNILEVKKGHILDTPASKNKWSPVKYIRDCYKIEQNGITGWVIDGISLGEADKTTGVKPVFTIFRINDNLYYYMIFCYLLLIFSLGIMTRKGWRALTQPDSNTLLQCLTFLIVLRTCLVFTTLYNAGAFVILGDEGGYFDVGKALFETHDFSQIRFTIGNSIIHGVFMKLLGATDIKGIILGLSYFNALFLGSISVLCFYFLVRLILRSKQLGLVATLIYILYPYLMQVSQTCGNIINDYLGLRNVAEYSLSLQFWADYVGFNGLSDTFNLTVILFLCCIMLKFYPFWDDECPWNFKFSTWLAPLLIGILFGFSGTIRVANILLLPFLIFIMIRHDFSRKNYPSIIQTMILLASGMLIGFLPQMIVNYLQFNSILTLPYHRFHGVGVARGFTLSYLKFGGRFCFGQISIMLSIALPGIFLVKRNIRIAVILFILPLLLFHAGYTSIVTSIRFLLPIYVMLIMLCVVVIRLRFYSVIGALLVIWYFKHTWRFLDDKPDIIYMIKIAVSMVIVLIIYAILRYMQKVRFYKYFNTYLIIMLSQIIIIGTNLTNFRYLFFLYLLIFCSSLIIFLKKRWYTLGKNKKTHFPCNAKS